MDWLWEFVMEWLSGKVLWVPAPIFLVYIVPLTQVLKKIFEALEGYDWFQGWAHGKGPIYMNALISALTVLLVFIGDGSPLTGEGAVQVILAFLIQAGLLTLGSAGLYELVRKYIFTKK